MSALPYDKEQRTQRIMAKESCYYEEWTDAERRLKQSGRNKEYRDQVMQSFMGIEWKVFPYCDLAQPILHVVR